jgi:CDGSH-type Zn-finger protein
VTTIRIQANGPYIVEGPIAIEDADGNVIIVDEGRAVKLCRCGHSGTKPYCDGTHRRVDFVSRPTFEPEVPVPFRSPKASDD